MKHRYSFRLNRTAAVGKLCKQCGADEWYGPYKGFAYRRCAVCQRKSAAAYKQNHPDYDKQRYARGREKMLAEKRAWRQEKSPPEMWAREALQHARDRSGVLGFPCTLTWQLILERLGKTCPVFGYRWAFQRGRTKPNSPSLDRLDNKKGYTPENVRIISHRANLMKSDGTVKEHQRLVEWMIAEGVP